MSSSQKRFSPVFLLLPVSLFFFLAVHSSSQGSCKQTCRTELVRASDDTVVTPKSNFHLGIASGNRETGRPRLQAAVAYTPAPARFTTYELAPEWARRGLAVSGFFSPPNKASP